MTSLFRSSINQDIVKELDKTVFTHYLFEVILEPEDSLFEIKFKKNENISFIVDEETYEEEYITKETPGEYAGSSQEYQCKDLKAVRNRISKWLVRIQEDFKSKTPEFDELEAFRNKIMKHLDEEEESANGEVEYFDEEEKSNLSEKLTSMQEKIDELYKEKDASFNQINEMHKQITKLKEAIEILDKRTWLSAAVNRVIDIYKEVKAAKNEVTTLFKDFDQMLPSPDESNNDKESNKNIN